MQLDLRPCPFELCLQAPMLAAGFCLSRPCWSAAQSSQSDLSPGCCRVYLQKTGRFHSHHRWSLSERWSGAPSCIKMHADLASTSVTRALSKSLLIYCVLHRAVVVRRGYCPPPPPPNLNIVPAHLLLDARKCEHMVPLLPNFACDWPLSVSGTVRYVPYSTPLYAWSAFLSPETVVGSGFFSVGWWIESCVAWTSLGGFWAVLGQIKTTNEADRMKKKTVHRPAGHQCNVQRLLPGRGKSRFGVLSSAGTLHKIFFRPC